MTNESTILLRARADAEIDNPPGFVVLRLTSEDARRYLGLLARAGGLEHEIPGFLRLEVSDYTPDWWTWTEPLDEVLYEPAEGPRRFPDELDYRVIDAADLQARLTDELEPAQPVSDDLVKVRVEKEGLSWEGIIRHTGVTIWTRPLPADVLREIAGAAPTGDHFWVVALYAVQCEVEVTAPDEGEAVQQAYADPAFAECAAVMGDPQDASPAPPALVLPFTQHEEVG